MKMQLVELTTFDFIPVLFTLQSSKFLWNDTCYRILILQVFER